jgi:hypothetical protein
MRTAVGERVRERARFRSGSEEGKTQELEMEVEMRMLRRTGIGEVGVPALASTICPGSLFQVEDLNLCSRPTIFWLSLFSFFFFIPRDHQSITEQGFNPTGGGFSSHLLPGRV